MNRDSWWRIQLVRIFYCDGKRKLHVFSWF